MFRLRNIQHVAAEKCLKIYTDFKIFPNILRFVLMRQEGHKS